MRPLRERLLQRIIVDPSGCWLWQGSFNEDGHGVFTVYLPPNSEVRKRKRVAHRLMYELTIGEVDPILTLDHLCRVRACVNPAHMEPVTRVENILRGVGPTAANARKSKCLHGHDLTEDNIYRNRRGNRHCRECALRRAREQKVRKKVSA